LKRRSKLGEINPFNRGLILRHGRNTTEDGGKDNHGGGCEKGFPFLSL
jgi:hypothetical protein